MFVFPIYVKFFPGLQFIWPEGNYFRLQLSSLLRLLFVLVKGLKKIKYFRFQSFDIWRTVQIMEISFNLMKYTLTKYVLSLVYISCHLFLKAWKKFQVATNLEGGWLYKTKRFWEKKLTSTGVHHCENNEVHNQLFTSTALKHNPHCMYRSQYLLQDNQSY